MGRHLKHYTLNMILAVGYRVRSPRGTQFRQWATARLEEYLGRPEEIGRVFSGFQKYLYQQAA